MVLRIDHVSIAVRDYEKADAFFTKLLGLIPGGKGRDESAGFYFQVYSVGDLSRFELIAPADDRSFLDSFLKEREGGVHHITFQVHDINAARSYLETENIPYLGFNDKSEKWKELFIHPSNAFGVLIQFAEFNPHEWINESEMIREKKEWEIKKVGSRMLFSILHPGGGKVEKEFSKAELDILINELVKIRTLI